MSPHLAQIYRDIRVGDIVDLYVDLNEYDVVLMADVIEHVAKPDGTAIVEHFVANGSAVIISTPKTFFSQSFYDSPYETHVSYWRPADFRFAPYLAWQTVGDGRIDLVSKTPRSVRALVTIR